MTSTTVRVIEVTGPQGTVMGLDISPVRPLVDVFKKLAHGSSLDEALSETMCQVGALPGDAIDFTHRLTIGGEIQIWVEEARGYIQDTYVYRIEGPAEKLERVEAELLQAARDAGLFRVRREAKS